MTNVIGGNILSTSVVCLELAPLCKGFAALSTYVRPENKVSDKVRLRHIDDLLDTRMYQPMASKISRALKAFSAGYPVLPKVGAGESTVSLCLAVAGLRSCRKR